MRLIALLSYPQSVVNALHIVIAPKYFTLVCNVIWVLVEMVNIAMVKIDNFCKNKSIAVHFKLFDGKYARTAVSKSERYSNLSIWILSNIVIVTKKRLSFDFLDPI